MNREVNHAKSAAGFGKEWYAISDRDYSNGFLNFIRAKTEELHAPLMKQHPTDTGIFWTIYNQDRSVFRHVPEYGIFLIHKAKFKHYLKKAIMKSFIRM